MDQIIFYGLIAAIAVLAFAVGFVAYMLTQKMSSFYKLVEEEVHARIAHIKASEVESKAESDASLILQNAHQKAAEIIKNTTTLSESHKNWFETQLLETAQKGSIEYNKALQELLKSASQNLNSQMDEMRKSALSEMSKTQASVLEDLKKQLEDYKKQKFEELDKNILGIIEDTTRKVLGRTFSKEEHEELVLQALEEAKNQNVF